MTKPLFMWAGGKSRLIKRYQPLFPNKIDSYCEPFFGGGAIFIHVMRNYAPSFAKINDLNPDIMAIYKSIKNDLPNFINRLDYLQSKYIPLNYSDRKTFYYDIRQDYAWDFSKYSPTEEAATLYFLMKTGFNGIFQINKNTNNRFGTPCGLLNQKQSVYDPNILDWWHNALQQTTIESADWKSAVEDCPENTFYFLDPPYRESFANYGNTFTDKNLNELIDFANKQKNVMLANRDDTDYFSAINTPLKRMYFDVTYTAGRRKKMDSGYSAKKAREILLYRNNNIL